MIRPSAVLLAISAVASTMTTVSHAQETGLDALHEQRREGNRICMVTHFHFGSSSGQPSRKQAEAAAIKDWASFTAWEYGPPWGSYNLAASKTMQCTQTGPASWGCNVEARPCKPTRRRR